MVAEAAAGKSKHQQLRAQAKAKKAAEVAAQHAPGKHAEPKKDAPAEAKVSP